MEDLTVEVCCPVWSVMWFSLLGHQPYLNTRPGLQAFVCRSICSSTAGYKLKKKKKPTSFEEEYRENRAQASLCSQGKCSIPIGWSTSQQRTIWRNLDDLGNGSFASTMKINHTFYSLDWSPCNLLNQPQFETSIQEQLVDCETCSAVFSQGCWLCHARILWISCICFWWLITCQHSRLWFL